MPTKFEDKRSNVLKAIADPEWSKRSNRVIDKTVAKFRENSPELLPKKLLSKNMKWISSRKKSVWRDPEEHNSAPGWYTEAVMQEVVMYATAPPRY